MWGWRSQCNREVLRFVQANPKEEEGVEALLGRSQGVGRLGAGRTGCTGGLGLGKRPVAS